MGCGMKTINTITTLLACFIFYSDLAYSGLENDQLREGISFYQVAEFKKAEKVFSLIKDRNQGETISQIALCYLSFIEFARGNKMKGKKNIEEIILENPNIKIDNLRNHIAQFGDQLHPEFINAFKEIKKHYFDRSSDISQVDKVSTTQKTMEDQSMKESSFCNILFIQRKLKSLYFYFGDVNGKLNPNTRLAIKNFQLANGLQPTGNFNDKMCDIIRDK